MLAKFWSMKIKEKDLQKKTQAELIEIIMKLQEKIIELEAKINYLAEKLGLSKKSPPSRK